MFYIGIILLGVISYTKLAINLLPDLSFPKITVVTHYAGSGPEEIERFITSQLEGPLAAIKGVKKITSVSQEGVSIITLEFHWGTDMDFAMLHTKEKTEEVRSSLPDDHEAPVIMEMDPSASPIMIVILDSDTASLKDQKDTAEYIIKPRLEQLEGISAVEIRGGDEEEISVEIDPDKIKNLGITLSNVTSAILQNNESPSGGTVKKDKFRYTLKIEGELKNPKEIESIVVANLMGRNITVKDIGTAFYKNKLKDGEIRFNSHPAISMLLFRESGGNTVNATRAAEKALENLEKEMTAIRFTTVSQEAELIIASINSLKSSLFLGAILAIFTLLLFLQNYRDPMLISVVIPIAIISTFVLMFFFNVQVNIMSLGGLVLGVGMFVDNCIIVLESIFRHRDKENLLTSVLNGAQEVSGAITASTLTTISIFLPVIYLYGVTGKLFRDQALTVSFSLISSLVVALTLLPALSAFRAVFKTDFQDDAGNTETEEKNKKKKWYQFPLEGLNFILLIPFKLLGYAFYFILGGLFLITKSGITQLGKVLNVGLKPLFRLFNRLYDGFDVFYHKILEKILNRKILALYISLLILVAILGTFLLLDKELLPAPESSKFEINGNTIPAYGFEETNRIASEIEEKLMKLDNVKFVFTESGAVSQEAGRSEDISVNSLHFIVDCASPEARPSVMDHAREILTNSKLMDFSLSQEQNTLSQYLATGGNNFQVKVFYDDIERGKEAVKLILAQIKDLEGLKDIKTTTAEGKPAYAISFKKELMNELNISKDYISNFINQAVRGERAGEIRLVQRNYDIYVRVPVDGIMAMSRLLSLPMHYNNNTYYLKDLIDIETRPSVKRIEKERQNMFFLVSADAPSAQLNKIIKKTEARMSTITFPPNTRASIAGEEEERRKAFDSLNQAIWLAIMLVYMIMAAKFENVWQPLIIMFTVPMGLIGAFLILLLTGNTLNIISGIGVMVLIGIGVNDAIVKIEYANQMRQQEGMSAREAVLAASKVRLRPILMTSLTTIFGVMPMALMRQTGSELQRPLALVIIGGLTFTTLLTLLLIPAFYELLENFKDKRKARNADQKA